MESPIDPRLKCLFYVSIICSTRLSGVRSLLTHLVLPARLCFIFYNCRSHHSNYSSTNHTNSNHNHNHNGSTNNNTGIRGAWLRIAAGVIIRMQRRIGGRQTIGFVRKSSLQTVPRVFLKKHVTSMACQHQCWTFMPAERNPRQLCGFASTFFSLVLGRLSPKQTLTKGYKRYRLGCSKNRQKRHRSHDHNLLLNTFTAWVIPTDGPHSLGVVLYLAHGFENTTILTSTLTSLL